MNRESTMEQQKMGRFGHHPDPAIDFCVEVEVIDGEVYDVAVGNGDLNVLEAHHSRHGLPCWCDEIAVNAKHILRQCAEKLRVALVAGDFVPMGA